MTGLELDMLHHFSIVYYQQVQSYFDENLPGISFWDPITDVIWLLSSKNPDLHIKASFDSYNSYSKYPINLENFTELIASQMSLNGKSKTNKTIFEFLLDPTIKDVHNEAVKIPINQFKRIFAKLNKTVSISELFSALWYSTLPCFDLRGVTSETEGQKALLRYK